MVLPEGTRSSCPARTAVHRHARQWDPTAQPPPCPSSLHPPRAPADPSGTPGTRADGAKKSLPRQAPQPASPVAPRAKAAVPAATAQRAEGAFMGAAAEPGTAQRQRQPGPSPAWSGNGKLGAEPGRGAAAPSTGGDWGCGASWGSRCQPAWQHRALCRGCRGCRQPLTHRRCWHLPPAAPCHAAGGCAGEQPPRLAGAVGMAVPWETSRAVRPGAPVAPGKGSSPTGQPDPRHCQPSGSLAQVGELATQTSRLHR